jgi:type IV secretion system protein VirB10
MWQRADTPTAEAADSGVRGDRGRSWVIQAQSVHARLSNMLAIGLVLAMGGGLLAWYYTHAALRPAGVRDTAHHATDRAPQGEMALPPLERAPAPPMAGASLAAEPPTLASTGPVVTGALPVVPAPGTLRDPGVVLPRRIPMAAARATTERRLSGPVFAAQSIPGPLATERAAPAAEPSAPMGMAPTETSARSAAGAGSGLSALLHAEPAATARATVLPTQRLLLPKGAFIDCTLETAIDSTLPGMTTCITATDTFGIDGKVVLLERGTKLVGETRGQVQQGTARVFVIWTQARTPTGVVVPLESPGTDELGRAGLAGTVDRHFWDRFGAAILISTIDGAVQAAVASEAHGGSTTVINPGSAQDVMTATLKSTLDIPPTVLKSNGDRIQILVARDIDFSGVYELRPLGDAH